MTDAPEYVAVPLDDLEPYPGNARRGDTDRIAASLDRYGQFRPITVQRSRMRVLAGNHTLAAARQLGWTHIDVALCDYDDRQAEQVNIIDNRLNDLSSYDDQALIEQLSRQPDLDAVGWDDDDLAALIAQAAPPATPDPESDPDTVPPVPAVAIARPGDVWTLGSHRLICGDAYDEKVHAVLLDGDTPNMILTDPPYGMRLDADFSSMKGRFRSRGSANKGKKLSGKKHDNVIGDHQDFDPSGLLALYRHVTEQFWWGADYYAERLPGKNDGSWVVWDKRKENQSEGIGSEFELCWSKARHKRRMLRHDWFGFLSSANGADARARLHPTQKPVTLLIDIMEQWGDPGDVVVDWFGGSGSTLIAAERSRRKARLVEIDPRYCDVTLRRYADITGDTPTHAVTGARFPKAAP